MSLMRVELTFPEAQIKEPVIYNLGKNFEIVTNIRRADVRADSSWMLLEMSGDITEIEKAIAYLEGLDIHVKPVEGDIVEG